MADPLATLPDYVERYGPQEPTDEPGIVSKLAEASRKVRGRYKTIDARILAGELDGELVKDVVCRMVARAVAAPTEMQDVTNASMTAGMFTQNLTFARSDGHLYLGKEDRKDLDPASGGYFTAQMWE